MAGVEHRTDVAVLVLAPRWAARYCWLSARLQYRVTAARYIEMARSGMLRVAADHVELADAGQLNRPAPDLEGTLRRLRRRAGSEVRIDELFHQRHVRIAQEARSTRGVLCRAGFGSWAPGGVVVAAASSWIRPARGGAGSAAVDGLGRLARFSVRTSGCGR